MALQGVTIEGEEELVRKLRALGDSVKGKQIERLFLRSAKVIRNAARELAPQGPTGNLKAGIIAKTLARRERKAGLAMVGINFRRAPHAHLLEFGTVKMSPRPFFRTAVIASQEKINKMISKGFQRIIDKVARTGRKV